jgi:hypothetical protein
MPCVSSGGEEPIAQRDGGMVMHGYAGSPMVPSAQPHCVAGHGVAQWHGTAPSVVPMLIAAVILLLAVASAGVSPAPL